MQQGNLFCITLPGMEVYLGTYFFTGTPGRPPRKHIHPTYELVCVREEGKTKFVIHPPLQEHFSQKEPAETVTSFLFTVLGNFEDDVSAKLRVVQETEVLDTFGGAERINALKEIGTNESPLAQEQRVAELRLLFVCLARALSGMEETRNFAKQTWNEERIARLEEYFNIHLHDPNCSKQQLAEELGVCERQLSRILEKTYRSSFSDILRESRLTLAEAMLEQGDQTPEEVASAVGYTSFGAFQRAWNKKFKKPFQK